MIARLNPRRALYLVVSVVLLAVGPAGCYDRGIDWTLYNVQGHLPDLAFTLNGVSGQPVTEAAFAGHTVLLFFGYASCPDVCPTTMAQLTEVLRRLGPDANNVRILFISVDPHRDTPELLQAYVNAFNPQAVGLTGDARAIARLARRYRVAYQIEAPKPGADVHKYEITHSRGVYIFDNQGRARLLASDAESADALTRDLQQLINLTRPLSTIPTGFAQ